MRRLINKIRYWFELKKDCKTCIFNFTSTVSKDDVCESCKENRKEKWKI